MASPGRRHALSSEGWSSAARVMIARRSAFASPCLARRAMVMGRAAKPFPRKRGPGSARHGEPSMASSGTMSHVCLSVGAKPTVRSSEGGRRGQASVLALPRKLDGWPWGAHLCVSGSALVAGGEHCASASSTSIVTTFRAAARRGGDRLLRPVASMGSSRSTNKHHPARHVRWCGTKRGKRPGQTHTCSLPHSRTIFPSTHPRSAGLTSLRTLAESRQRPRETSVLSCCLFKYCFLHRFAHNRYESFQRTRYAAQSRSSRTSSQRY